MRGALHVLLSVGILLCKLADWLSVFVRRPEPVAAAAQPALGQELVAFSIREPESHEVIETISLASEHSSESAMYLVALHLSTASPATDDVH